MKRLMQFLIILLTILLPIMVIISIPHIDIDKEIVVSFNSSFNDEYRASSLFYDYTDEVEVNSNVDTSKLGIYEINYELKFGPFTIHNKKEVNVVDKTSPVIELVNGNEVNVCPNCEYVEDGYKAIDDYDKDITDKVEVINKDNEIIYRVSDSSGNSAEVIRKINYVDKEKPVIKLKGDSEISIYLNSSYNELGYSATDNCDGDITKNVSVTNKVDTSKIGSYDVTYSVSDKAGNSNMIKRKVNVINRPVYTGVGNGVIYLTFDDGPSNITSSILDLLDKYGIKATFFVTNNVNNYPNILKRAYNSGHSIGLHTYTHEYSTVYSSVNNYFLDLSKIDNAVYNIIGIHSKIIRFPGGSSNTISRNYSIGIMSTLSNEVVNRGYNYFDWNIDSNDAGSDVYNSSNIYKNVINGLSHNKANVVLMHDSGSHNATYMALDSIITYAINNGYRFDILKSNTTPVHHGINN